MIQKDRYFDLLFKNLQKNDLLVASGWEEQRYNLQDYFDKADIDVGIIYEMEEQYGIGLQNVFLIKMILYKAQPA